MTEAVSIAIFLSALFFLLGTSVWVGAALLATAVLGMFLFTSAPIGDSMAVVIWGEQSSWTLTALPLFIWMGEILFRTNLSETLFKGLAPFMRGLPGGLLHVNIGASAIFAAISGSSAATVATVGKMSIPELGTPEVSGETGYWYIVRGRDPRLAHSAIYFDDHFRRDSEREHRTAFHGCDDPRDLPRSAFHGLHCHLGCDEP